MKRHLEVCHSPAIPSLYYTTDLSDVELALLEPLLPPPKPRGQPPKWPLHLIVNGMLYIVRTGCQWCLLLREFPPWRTVYHYFRL
ncbi:MAG: transposase [Chloroflexi bacterium]|nr:transposase [Chloroflexota bacterium]